VRSPKTLWAVVNPENGELCAAWRGDVLGWVPMVGMGTGPEGDQMPEYLARLARAAAKASGRTLHLTRYVLVEVAETIVP